MNEVLEQIEVCKGKISIFNVNQVKLGNEIRNFVQLKKINTNLTTKEMYYNRNPMNDDILTHRIDIIVGSDYIIDYVEKLISDSKIKNYIAVVLRAYIEDFYNGWLSSKNNKNSFNKKLLSDIKKIVKEKDFNIIVDSFFEISKKVIIYKKENPDIRFANNIMYAWLFYFLMFIDKYDDSMQCFNKIYVKETLDSLDIVKELAVNNKYISKKQIRELDNKCEEMEAIYNISEEYKTLKNLIKNYNSSFFKKEDVKPQVLITLPEKHEQEPNQKVIVPIINREERIRLYNAKKNKHHPYIDDESTLTTDEIEYASAYVEMVLEKSISNKFNIDQIIDDIPEEEFNSETDMLKEIISKLKLNNINSNTNKVLIKLNNRLKEIVVKKKAKRN